MPDPSDSSSSPIYKLTPGHDLTLGRDLAAENRRKLAELFPGLLSETVKDGQVTHAIDADVLRDLVGVTVDNETREKFGLSWHGKSAARRLALTPSTGTLRPAPGESVDWDTTQNVLIEGDNLEVLKLLQKAYAGKVKLIYIDPPYNTGNDFVYKDDFRDPIGQYQRTIGDADAEGTKLTTNADTGGRFHTTWLNMIYPRLLLARELLREDGVICISIGDGEMTHLDFCLRSVFGEENFAGLVTWKARAKPVNIGDAKFRPQREVEYVAMYQKRSVQGIFQPIFSGGERSYPFMLGDRKYRLTTILKSNRGTNFRETMSFELEGYTPPEGQRWQAGEDEIRRLFREGYIEFRDGTPSRRYFQDEEPDEHDPFYCYMDRDKSGTSEGGKTVLNEILGNNHGFDTVKPMELLQTLLQSCTHISTGDVVLDFFAGSGTTGHAVMAQNAADGGNRRFVLVQLPEPTGRDDYKTIADLTAERLRRAGKKIREEHEGKLESQATKLDTGFRVFKLDSANVKAWEAPTTDVATASQIGDLIEGAVDAVKNDRTDADLLWGVMINLGLALDSIVETRDVNGHTLYVAGGGTLVCCFSKAIDLPAGESLATAIAGIAAEKKLEGELTVVLRDSAFGGKDDVKVNLVENLKQNLPPGVTKSRVLSL